MAHLARAGVGKGAYLSGCRSLSSDCVSSRRLAALRYSFSSSGTIDGTFSRYLQQQQYALCNCVLINSCEINPPQTS